MAQQKHFWILTEHYSVSSALGSLTWAGLQHPQVYIYILLSVIRQYRNDRNWSSLSISSSVFHFTFKTPPWDSKELQWKFEPLMKDHPHEIERESTKLQYRTLMKKHHHETAKNYSGTPYEKTPPWDSKELQWKLEPLMKDHPYEREHKITV